MRRVLPSVPLLFCLLLLLPVALYAGESTYELSTPGVV
jgi:hypothetical protein